MPQEHITASLESLHVDEEGHVTHFWRTRRITRAPSAMSAPSNQHPPLLQNANRPSAQPSPFFARTPLYSGVATTPSPSAPFRPGERITTPPLQAFSPSQDQDLHHFSPATEDYINHINERDRARGNLTNSELIALLELTEEEEKAFEPFMDPISKEIMDIPVEFNEHYYDLTSLQMLPEQDGFRLSPIDRYPFTVRDLHTARRIDQAIQDQIQIILAQREQIDTTPTLAYQPTRHP